MNVESKKLFILPFPQYLRINEAGPDALICNVVLLPRNNPLEPLVAGDDQTAFAKASFQLKAWMVEGKSDELPTTGDHAADASYHVKTNIVLQPADRSNAFTEIATHFDIAENPADPDAPAPLSTKKPVELRKYLPEAYRNAFSFSQPRNSNAVMDDSYFCALKSNDFAQPYVRNDKVNWAQVLAFALQQPLLAKALGILYTDIEVPIDNPAFFKEGGWIYFDFDETNIAGTTLHLTGSTDVQYYAARIPAATASRQVFAPLLFPALEVIDEFGNTEATVPFDDVFKEAVIYDDGFAKIVHCSQAINSNPILETKDGPAPLMDTGIRLGWDDEQVLTWMSRSFSETHLPVASQKAHSTLAVSKYRIDVCGISKGAYDSDDSSITENETDGNWKSQVAITSTADLTLGDIDLGMYEGESGVQVSPARSNDTENRLWLPAFFSFWNGSSLAVPDPVPDEINKVAKYKEVSALKDNDKNNPVLYKQLAGTEILLRYGSYYAFRVRLSDISGGGPDSLRKALTVGPNGICKHLFTRNVAPSPPTVIDTDGGLTVRRSRLGYPAILFATDDPATAVQLLKQDRIALDTDAANLAKVDPITGKYVVKNVADPGTFDLFKSVSREASIADPDVDKLHIVVEVQTLEMDRENSYNAIHGITPKESFLLLYETSRSFSDYNLSLDDNEHTITIPFEYRDAPVLFFNDGEDAAAVGLGAEPAVASGPLILPTARKIRLTIRSWCSQNAVDYFGDDDFRLSTPVKRDVRTNIATLEDTALLLASPDPLVSVFFRQSQLRRCRKAGRPLQEESKIKRM
ncbi:MAG: hypothetical protein QM802_03175 [Agriterribacter sp.]